MLSLILGDLHLGKNSLLGKVALGSQLNSRVADQSQLLDWVLERSIDQMIDNIIITGDVFEDPKPHPSIITLFMAWLKKCQAHHIHVHVIIGNHDILRSGNFLVSPLDIIGEAELDNVSIYKNITTIFLGNTAFTFMPFRDRKSFGSVANSEAISMLRDSLTYEVASIPSSYKKILVGHLAIEGSIPVGDEIDDIANELFCPVSMFSEYDYVWMGHVHKPQIMSKRPFIAHIGSMDISNFGETDQKKHIVIIDCINNRDFEIEYLPCRPLKKVSIIVPKDIVDTEKYVIDQIDAMKNDWDRAIIKVEIELSSPELKSIGKVPIEKYFTSKGAFGIASVSETRKTVVVKKTSESAIDNKMDVISAINTYAHAHVDENMRADFTELALDIYNQYKAENN